MEGRENADCSSFDDLLSLPPAIRCALFCWKRIWLPRKHGPQPVPLSPRSIPPSLHSRSVPLVSGFKLSHHFWQVYTIGQVFVHVYACTSTCMCAW